MGAEGPSARRGVVTGHGPKKQKNAKKSTPEKPLNQKKDLKKREGKPPVIREGLQQIKKKNIGDKPGGTPKKVGGVHNSRKRGGKKGVQAVTTGRKSFPESTRPEKKEGKKHIHRPWRKQGAVLEKTPGVTQRRRDCGQGKKRLL